LKCQSYIHNPLLLANEIKTYFLFVYTAISVVI